MPKSRYSKKNFAASIVDNQWGFSEAHHKNLSFKYLKIVAEYETNYIKYMQI